MALFLSLLVALVGAGVSLATLRLVARWLAAGNTSWSACTLALVVPWVVGLFASVALTASGAGEGASLAGLVILLVVQMGLVARFLDTSFLLAIPISLLSSLAAGLVLVGGMFVLVTVLGVGLVGLFGMAGLMGGDSLMQPGAGGPWQGGGRGTVEITIDDQQRAAGRDAGREHQAWESDDDETREAPRRPQQRVEQFEFRAVLPDSLPEHLNGGIRVTLDDGREIVGVLKAVDATRIQIETRTKGGTFEFPVRRSAIRLVEIWRRL